MYGAVAGDICGSKYEFKPCKDKEAIDLFRDDSHLTDDTVVMMGVFEAINGGEDLAKAVRHRCLQSMNEGYALGFGLDFMNWVFSPEQGPYGSWGNGAAMRVPSIPFLASSIEEAAEVAKKAAEITHNHHQGVRGAQAVAVAGRMALEGWSKDEIARVVSEKYKYDLSVSLDEIRPKYSFEVSCQGSVPEAISAFLQSNSFEETMVNTISLGGDADTQACISGFLWEAANGLPPQRFIDLVDSRLNSSLSAILSEFYRRASALEVTKTSPDGLAEWNEPPRPPVDLGGEQQVKYEREMERLEALVSGAQSRQSGQRGLLQKISAFFGGLGGLR